MEVFIKKFLLATDFSDISTEASKYALLLAQMHNAELKVLHVFDTSMWTVPAQYYLESAGPLYTRATEDLEKAKQRGKNKINELAESFPIKVEKIFTTGDPGNEIIRVTEELDTDLVILGTHGYSGWKKFTIGSVAEFVTKYAPCSVLTVRPERRNKNHVK